MVEGDQKICRDPEFKPTVGLFSVEDIEKTIKGNSFSKALGPDLLDGSCLSDENVRANCIYFMWHSLNKLDIKPYLSNSKLLLLSKVESNEVALKDVRTIQILSHLTKIMETAIKIKRWRLVARCLNG